MPVFQQYATGTCFLVSRGALRLLPGVPSVPAPWDGSTKFSGDQDQLPSSGSSPPEQATEHQSSNTFWTFPILFKQETSGLVLTTAVEKDAPGVFCWRSSSPPQGLQSRRCLHGDTQAQGHVHSGVVQQHLFLPVSSWMSSLCLLEPPGVLRCGLHKGTGPVLSILLQFLFSARHHLPLASASARGN